MNQPDGQSFFQRAFFLAIGLFIMAFGTALSVQALLGTSPITSVPLVLHLWRPAWSVGAITIAMNVFFLLATAVLRRHVSARQIIQIALLGYYGFCIDLNICLLKDVSRLSYPVRLSLTFPGAALAGFGVWAQVHSRFPMLPGDGLVKTISEVFRFDFAKTKIVFDCILVVTAVLLSKGTMGVINGVREGTLIAAIFVGVSVKVYEHVWHWKSVGIFVGKADPSR